MLELFAPIRTFVFEADGVLTDGSLMLSGDGHMLRSMNIKDGFAIQLAIKKGYSVWVVASDKSEALRLGLNKLGVHEVHFGIESKEEFLHELTIKSKTAYESILYMGYDLPDHAAMQVCGLPCCPCDAANEIKQIAKYISPFGGGKGCVRDVIEKVLKLNGDWSLPA
jgi:3-deoxy-D-manno-octulosonate 8-phosphate phosphatase (KDO 8-P phosphatase)